MKISSKALLLLILPAMLAACSVRGLNDGSYTTCKVGNPCQHAPEAAVSKKAVKHKRKAVKKVEAAKDAPKAEVKKEEKK